MPKLWGLDIGTTSVGWAIVVHDEAREDGTVERTGVRIFPEGTDEDGAPRNLARRAARLLRRQIRRRRRRRKEVGDLMAEAGLLPPFGTEEWDGCMRLDPYPLRAKGAGECLDEPWQAGRALYHLVKRRGFLSVRHLDESEGTDKDTDGLLGEIQGLRGNLEGHTLGSFLAGQDKKRGRHTGRDMYLAEFEAIWTEQARHRPELFTDDLRSRLFATAFYQRPTYWRLDTLGTCRFEGGGADLCSKGSWLGQRFVLLQTLNSLRLAGGNEAPLEGPDREKALALLSSKATVTFAGLRKALGLPKSQLFNFEVGGKKDIKGNAVEAALAKCFGKAWTSLPAADAIRAGIHGRLFEVYYRRAGNHRIEIRRPEEIEAEKAKFVAAAMADWMLAPDQAGKLSNLSLPSGWLRLSGTAVEKLLPHLEAGKRYDEAVELAYGRGHSQAEQTGEVLDRLPSRPKQMPDVRNPTVNRALNETRKVVNNLLAAHGRPDVIRIELARDLKLPRKKKEELEKRNKAQERKRKEGREELEKNRILDPSGADIEKWLLWKECNETCPYTGDKIGFDALFRHGEFEIEHIVPKSRSFDNSFANKTLCGKDVNIAKGNRTPFEYFRGRPAEWEQVGVRLRNLPLPPPKVRRFLREDWPQEELDQLAERQLRDTAHIAREVRDFVARLGSDIKVEVSNGRVTAQLRKLWGLNHILGDDGTKNRADHRHHAVDAVAVALAAPRFVKRLSEHYAAEREMKPSQLPPPWRTLRRDVEDAVGRIVVSHRVRRKISGRLHEQTTLGLAFEKPKADGRFCFVKRKPLTELSEGEIADIRDPGVRALVEARIGPIRERIALMEIDKKKKKEMMKKEVKEALSLELRMPRRDGTVGPKVSKVRIFVDRQMQAMHPLKLANRAYAELGKGSLHHIAIYERNGEAIGESVTRVQVASRQAQGLPIVDRTHKIKGNFVVSLCPGDMLEVQEKGGDPTYYVVRKFNEKGRVFYKPATMATDPKPEVSFGPQRFLDGDIRKVAVDPIGRVRPAHD